MVDSKEQIKERILKNAARMWGLSTSENEASFDPLVAMLVSACSSELENISHQLNESQTRVAEKLIELLNPDTSAGIEPAHAIAYGAPIENEHFLKSTEKFSIKKPLANGGLAEIDFCPTHPVKLIKGHVKYLAFEDGIYKLDQLTKKERICRSNSPLTNTKLWIGLKLSDIITPLEGVSFYFDLKNPEQHDFSYHSLKTSLWAINNFKLTMKTGYYEGPKSIKFHQSQNSELYNKSKAITEKVKKYYKHQFMTIEATNQRSPVLQSKLPTEFNLAFDEKAINILDEDVVWIKIEFSSSIDPSFFKDLTCKINTFPIINKSEQNKTFKLKEFLNILPIVTVNSFYSLAEVRDDLGKEYYSSNHRNTSNLGSDQLIVRSEGMNRFGDKNASDYISLLLELLRDESASFSVFNKDKLSKDVTNLNQIISRLEKRNDKSENPKKITYLLLKPEKKAENLYVRYSTTNGTLANGFKVGTRLKVKNGSDFDQNIINTLSTSMGGADELSYEGRFNAYRASLLTRDKIVTIEDIRAHSLAHFEGNIESVEIQKGIMSHPSLKEGFVRTIDIYIKASNKEYVEYEWTHLCKDLLLSLQEKSSNIYPYRFFINHKEYVLEGQLE